MDHEQNELTAAERVNQMHFPTTVFNYLGMETKQKSISKRVLPHASAVYVSVEDKESFLIAKNREALEQQMRILEHHDITEDSICSD